MLGKKKEPLERQTPNILGKCLNESFLRKVGEVLRLTWLPPEIRAPLVRCIKVLLRIKNFRAPNRVDIRRSLVPTSTELQVEEVLSSDVADLEKKLWSGFSQSAIRDLDSIIDDSEKANETRASAAWILAGWFSVESNFIRAKGYFETFFNSSQLLSHHLQNALLASYCYVQSESYTSSAKIIAESMEIEPNNPNLFLAMANSCAAPDGSSPSISNDENRLEWINKVYASHGIAGICKKNPKKLLTISNLAADVASSSQGEKIGKVSVIVPVYNCEKTLEIALDGLLAQTWANLEIIVIDDNSTDATQDVIDRFQAIDRRIVFDQLAANKGAYSARNRGIELATGEFITVHDADDWSHPLKIELQAKKLVNEPNILAVYSNMSRVSDDMIFLGKYRNKAKLLDWNPSSLMFRKAVLEKIGAWDAVRISGDSEFLNRMRNFFPGQVVGMPNDYPPLSFTLAQSDSLTFSGPTHGSTTTHGVRREYREAANYWHQTATTKEQKLATHPNQRPFPVPAIMLPEKKEIMYCDFLLIADFMSGEANLMAALQKIRLANLFGLKICVFHWPHYALDVTLPLGNSLRKFAAADDIKILAPGEVVTAKVTHVMHPAVFQHMIDRPLKLATKKVYAIFDRLPPDSKSHLFYFDFVTVSENMEKICGMPAHWVAANAEIMPDLKKAAELTGVSMSDESYEANDEMLFKLMTLTDHNITPNQPKNILPK